MNDEQIRLYQSLGKAFGDKVIDPDYLPYHKVGRCTEALKEWVRENWADRRNFPSWVDRHIRRWKEAKAAREASGAGGTGGLAAGAGDGQGHEDRPQG